MSQFPTHGARPVWIASYPRSGNTYLRIILWTFFRLPSYSVYYVEGTTHADPSADALQEAPLLPRHWRETLSDRNDAPPVLIKTHEPPSDSAPAVYIARDGRAAIHSYYHYHKKFSFEQPSLTEIIAGACQFGSWSDHYWAWSPTTRPKTLLVSYDELVSRPHVTVERLAAFLNLTPEDAPLPKFDALQRLSPAFFRRGQNTDYMTEWTQGQLELFNQLHASAMQELGFETMPSAQVSGSVVKELAQSAARLHRMYLEQLSNLGQSAAHHRETVQDLSNQIRQLSYQVKELSRQIDQELKPQIQTRWARLGKAIGAVTGTQENKLQEPVAEPGPLPSGSPESDRPVKASHENTQSSAPGPGSTRLSGSSEGVSAPV